ncbi:hypothetical protein P7C70_g7964, partial [Phenoliferia sp. Uapishka_3]
MCQLLSTPRHTLTLDPLPIGLRQRAKYRVDQQLDYLLMEFRPGMSPFVAHPFDVHDEVDPNAPPRVNHYLKIHSKSFGRPLKTKAGTLDFDVTGSTAYLGELDNLGGLWMAIVDRDRPRGEADPYDEHAAKRSPMSADRLALVAEYFLRTLLTDTLASTGRVYEVGGSETLDWSQIPVFIDLFLRDIAWLKNLLGPWAVGKSVIFVVCKFGQDLRISTPHGCAPFQDYGNQFDGFFSFPSIKQLKCAVATNTVCEITKDPILDVGPTAPTFDYDDKYRPSILLNLPLLEGDCSAPALMRRWTLGFMREVGNMTGESSPLPFETHFDEINDDKASCKRGGKPLRLESLNLYSMMKQSIRPTAGSHEIVRGKMTAGLSITPALVGPQIWGGEKRKALSKDVEDDQPFKATLQALEVMKNSRDLKGIRLEDVFCVLFDELRPDEQFQNFSCVFKDYLVPGATAVEDTMYIWKKYFVLYDPEVWPGALVTITELLWRPISRIKALRTNKSDPVPFAHREIVAVLERLLRCVHTGNLYPMPADIGRSTGISSSLLAYGYPCINFKVMDLRKLTLNLHEYGKGAEEGKLQLAHVSAAPYYFGNEELKQRMRTFALQEYELLLVREKSDLTGRVPKEVLRRMVKVLVRDIGQSYVEPMIAKMARKRTAIYRRDIENADKVKAGEVINVVGKSWWQVHEREAVSAGMRESADEMDGKMKHALDEWKAVATHSWDLGFERDALIDLNFPFESFTPAEEEVWDTVLVSRLYLDPVRGLTFDNLARGILREAIPDAVVWPGTLKPLGHPRVAPWILEIQTLYDAFCFTEPRVGLIRAGFGAETLVTLFADELRRIAPQSWPGSGRNQHSLTDYYVDYTRFIPIGVTGIAVQAQEVEVEQTPQVLVQQDRLKMIEALNLDISSSVVPEFLTKECFEPFLELRCAKDEDRGRYLRRILEAFDYANPAHRVFALRALTLTSHADRHFPYYNGRRNRRLGTNLPPRSTLLVKDSGTWTNHRNPETLVSVFISYMLLHSITSLQTKRTGECESEDLFEEDKGRRLDLRIFHLAGLVDVDYTQVKSTKSFPSPCRGNRGITMRHTSAADWTLLWMVEVRKWDAGEYVKLLTWCYPVTTAKRMVAKWTGSQARMDEVDMLTG